jgi:formyltetrahydrofolate-dependent phosphoribosylglycinamide formyltransferase
MTPQRRPVNLAVMLSGSGRTLLNIVDRVERGALDARIAIVIASKECLGAERARAAGLRTLIMPGEIRADDLGRVLDAEGVGLVALAGYVRLLAIPPAYRGRILNIHPALLPSFGGPGMYGHRVHQAVLDAGCKVSGCTVHLCDESYDRGPILVQKVCPVLEGDDAQTLAARVFELEKEAYPEAIELLIDERVQVIGGRARILPGPAGARDGE